MHRYPVSFIVSFLSLLTYTRIPLSGHPSRAARLTGPCEQDSVTLKTRYNPASRFERFRLQSCVTRIPKMVIFCHHDNCRPAANVDIYTHVTKPILAALGMLFSVGLAVDSLRNSETFVNTD